MKTLIILLLLGYPVGALVRRTMLAILALYAILTAIYIAAQVIGSTGRHQKRK